MPKKNLLTEEPNLTMAWKEYNNGLKEYEDGVKEFNEKIADAEEELKEGRSFSRKANSNIMMDLLHMMKVLRSTQAAFLNTKRELNNMSRTSRLSNRR